MNQARSLSDRLALQKISEQRDMLRKAVEDIRRGALDDWRFGRTDAETAMEGVRDVLDALPRYLA